ncbi:hypothetical protein SLS58_003831 [Diplodia intermedia]|uniref:Uncharacterized protein n=1 Tax=Diplodia intermedia TaxID=856260 RepID=A0ABR3TW62_9PEZI
MKHTPEHAMEDSRVAFSERGLQQEQLSGSSYVNLDPQLKIHTPNDYPPAAYLAADGPWSPYVRRTTYSLVVPHADPNHRKASVLSDEVEGESVPSLRNFSTKVNQLVPAPEFLWFKTKECQLSGLRPQRLQLLRTKLSADHCVDCDYDSNVLSRYESFGRERLPQLVRQSLEVAVYNNEVVVEDQLRSQLVGIVQRSLEEVFTQFRQQERTFPPRGPSEIAPQGMIAAQPQDQEGPVLTCEPNSTEANMNALRTSERMLPREELMDDAQFQPDAANSNDTQNNWGSFVSDEQPGIFAPFPSRMGEFTKGSSRQV